MRLMLMGMWDGIYFKMIEHITSWWTKLLLAFWTNAWLLCCFSSTLPGEMVFTATTNKNTTGGNHTSVTKMLCLAHLLAFWKTLSSFFVRPQRLYTPEITQVNHRELLIGTHSDSEVFHKKPGSASECSSQKQKTQVLAGVEISNIPFIPMFHHIYQQGHTYFPRGTKKSASPRAQIKAFILFLEY